MLSTVKGYYDHGQIILNEASPVQQKTAVIVTFLTEEETPQQPKERVLGGLEGRVTTPDDFNDPLDDLKDYM